MLGVVRLGGGSSIWGMGKSCTRFGGARAAKEGLHECLGHPWQRAFPLKPFEPIGDSPQSLTLPSQLGGPDGFSPGPQRPWEGVGDSGATRIPGSLRTLDWPSYFPHPLVQPQAKALGFVQT